VDGRIRVGVFGAGSMAQMMHLPYLRDLADRFAITALCDVAIDTTRLPSHTFTNVASNQR